jgi:Tfp pilus assembly protein PilZ
MSQEDSQFANRRRYERISTKIPVRISTIEPERDPWTGRPFFRASKEVCGNVSHGGAFVKTTEPLTPGRRLLVEVQLPGSLRLEAIGRVAWTKHIITPNAPDGESGIGIEFIGGASGQFAALDGYIHAQQGSTEPPEH